MKMAAIQPKRSRLTAGRSNLARSASTDEIRAARTAGSIAARIVMATPIVAATAEPAGSMPGTVAVRFVAALTASDMTRASAVPKSNPIPDPRMPSTRAPVKTKRATWPRVAPAARRRPTSRARSPTVIDSVLTMRNAPTKRTIAATREAVAWKSADEARRLVEMSAGEARTYGSVIR